MPAWPAEQVALPEASIGPYSIVRLIREGGQGRVYLGYDRRLHRQVAIKVHALPSSRAQRRRAISEARKAAGISDVRVVQIFDVIESRGYLAIIMEYVPGCDLEELINRVRLSVPAVIRIGADIAAALSMAAEKRVVHGDVKAGNVLVSRAGRAKLADFGIARVAGARADGAGSPAVAAPEQAADAPADLRSDLFSLGCLLYRMLSGVPPFPVGAEPVRAPGRYRQPPPLEVLHPGGGEIPLALRQLVADLLHGDPQLRVQDTHRVRQVLRNAARAYPLARADSLAVEAAACFRPESSGDIPPQIPLELRRHGRSRLVRRGLEFWGQQFRRLRPFVQGTLLLIVCLVLFMLFESLTMHLPPRVHFEKPEISLEASLPYVDDFGSRWLMRAVQSAVEARIGPMQVSGSAVPQNYFLHLASRAPQIVVSTSLHCSKVLCVFFVSRRDQDGYQYRHALIPPQLPRRDWESLLEQRTAELFP